MNTPEVIRPRTKNVHDRLALLQNPPRIVQLDEFAPREGECYFLGMISSHRRQLVHPPAHVSAICSLASGVFVEPYARLRSGCNVAGHGRAGYGAAVGLGATIIEELEIGSEAYVATGAVVIRDVPARVLVAGVPAEIKESLS